MEFSHLKKKIRHTYICPFCGEQNTVQDHEYKISPDDAKFLGEALMSIKQVTCENCGRILPFPETPYNK